MFFHHLINNLYILIISSFFALEFVLSLVSFFFDLFQVSLFILMILPLEHSPMLLHLVLILNLLEVISISIFLTYNLLEKQSYSFRKFFVYPILVLIILVIKILPLHRLSLYFINIIFLYIFHIFCIHQFHLFILFMLI